MGGGRGTTSFQTHQSFEDPQMPQCKIQQTQSRQNQQQSGAYKSMVS